MMKKGGVASFVMVLVVVLAVLAEVHGTVPVKCDPSGLAVCRPAITGSGNPTAECCSRLKEQVPCFCEYRKNPAFAPYVRSPNAKKLLTACGIKRPFCLD